MNSDVLSYLTNCLHASSPRRAAPEVDACTHGFLPFGDVVDHQ